MIDIQVHSAATSISMNVNEDVFYKHNKPRKVQSNSIRNENRSLYEIIIEDGSSNDTFHFTQNEEIQKIIDSIGSRAKLKEERHTFYPFSSNLITVNFSKTYEEQIILEEIDFKPEYETIKTFNFPESDSTIKIYFD